MINLKFFQVENTKKVKCNKNVTLNINFSDNLKVI